MRVSVQHVEDRQEAGVAATHCEGVCVGVGEYERMLETEADIYKRCLGPPASQTLGIMCINPDN